METIYDIQTGYQIEQFVFHEHSLFEIYQSATDCHDAMESLFIRETTDGMDLSLYLAKTTIDNLTKDNPFDRLHRGNLNSFCLAVEGISHFVYLIWNATHQRSVTQLEMELQAEVDKYILSASLLASQADGTLPLNLCELLFEDISFSKSLSQEKQKRYKLANQYAKHYCNHIHDRLTRFREGNLITKEIRRFYRLWHNYKMLRINAVPILH